MFGSKKKKEAKKIEQTKQKETEITTIPDIFYGGHDPVIYKEQKPVAATTKTSTKKGKPTKKKHTAPKVPLSKAKKRGIMSGIIVLFILIVAGISWFYLRDLTPAVPQQQEIVVPEVEPPTEIEETQVIEEVPTSTIEEVIEAVPTTTVEITEEVIDFPSTILIDSPDLDNDELTDVEEELFGLDTAAWDTDEDGYYDGQEVVNLYNPSGLAPIKLIDSGFIREYIQPLWQYRLYYPTSWEAAAVDPEGRQVLFSTITGDYIEVRVMDNLARDTFADWFSQNITNQNYLDIIPITNRFKEQGYKRNDSLVAYFMHNDHVFVLIYHPGTTGTIPYRHISDMIIQSFRTSKTTVEIPDQIIIPEPPTTTIDSTTPIQEIETPTTTTQTPTGI